MPPKRKAPAAKAKAGGKKAKKTEPAVSEPAVLEVKDAITKLKTQSDKKVTHKPDTVCSKASQVEVSNCKTRDIFFIHSILKKIIL